MWELMNITNTTNTTGDSTIINAYDGPPPKNFNDEPFFVFLLYDLKIFDFFFTIYILGMSGYQLEY